MDLYLEYLRKSRTDRDFNGSIEEVLSRHEKLLDTLAQEQGYHVVKKYKEIVSGDSISARPEMQKLLAEVETGKYAGVLVVDIDRLARGNTIDQGIVSQTFQYTDTKIITPQKVYDPNDEFDQEYFEFSLFMGRKEYKMIKKRLNRGRISSSNEGKYCGNVAPYGYDRYKLENEKGYSLRPNPAEAPIVKKIFKLYNGIDTPRKGIALIARELNALHVPTRKGASWVSSSVSSILRNPVYAGYIRWNYRRSETVLINGNVTHTRPRHPNDYILAEGLHEPLISKELYESTQKLFRENRRTAPVNAKHEFKNPLAGIITCSCCGRKMVRRPNANPRVRDTLICTDPQCPTVASYLDLVEAELLKELDRYTRDMEMSNDLNANDLFQLDYRTSALENLTADLTRLNAQREKLYDLLEQGVYSVDIFKHRMNKLNKELEQTQEKADSLQSEIDAYNRESSRIRSFLPRTRYLLDNYDMIAVQEKNEVLKELLDHVEYTKTERNKFRKGNEISFKLKIFPKL